MAEPITWRNVTGPSPADAATPLRYAGDQLNQGFAQLQKALGLVTENDAANWQNTKVNNTQALVDELRGAKTPEQVAALEQSGRLDQMKQAMGAQFDRNAINQLQDNRMNVVRDDLTKAQQFTEAQQMEAEKPLARQFEMARLKGDTATMARIAQENPNALFLPKQLDAARTQAHQDFQWDREKIKAGYEDKAQPIQQAILEDSQLDGPAKRKVSQQNADAATQQAATGELTATAHLIQSIFGPGAGGTKSASGGAGGGSAEKKAFDIKMADSGLDKGTINNAVGIENLMKGFKELGVDDQQQKDIFKNLRENFPNGIQTGETKDGKPIYEDIPVSFVLRAASQAPEDKFMHFLGTSARGDNTRIMMNKLYSYRVDGEVNKNQDKDAIAALQMAKEARANRAAPVSTTPATPSAMEVKRQALFDSLLTPITDRLAQKKTR